MNVFVALFVFTIASLGAIACIAYFSDLWLRGIDKGKYITKSLKRQLKKGDITESEYEERLNPSQIMAPSTSEILSTTESEIPAEKYS